MTIAQALKLREAAKLLGVHPNTLRKLNAEGELAGFRYTPNGPWYFTKAALEQYQKGKIDQTQLTQYAGKELAALLAEVQTDE